MGKATKKQKEKKAKANGSKQVLDGAQVILLPNGKMVVHHSGDIRPRELPTLLRQAAAFAEKELIDE